MTSASGDSGRAWTRFVLVQIGVSIALLVGISATLAYVDPYWVWRRSPPWLLDGRTANENLDNKMRFVKAMTAAQSRFDLVWIGSSRVYRGVDVGCLDGRVGYNLGVAGMMLDEVRTYIRLASEWGRPKTIVVGLDYFMFGSRDRPMPIDPKSHTIGWQIYARLQSLISWSAIEDAWKLPTAEAAQDGRWLMNGFKQTVARPGSYTTLVQKGLKLDRVHTDPQLMSLLPKVLEEAKRSGADFRFYIGPESDAYLSLIRNDGDWSDFQHWRAYVREQGLRFGISILDMAEDHPFSHFDWASGSTENWIDTMHFGPPVGAYVARRLGFATSCSSSLS